MTPLLTLVRSPRAGAAAVLARGRLTHAALLIVLATGVAAIDAARFIGDVPVSRILYGPDRSPAVATLLDLIGRDRTAIVAYLIEQSWTAVIVVTALSPILLWVLGSTAVHAAARLDGRRAPLMPMFVLFGYATALTRIPGDAAAAILGNGAGVGPQIAQMIGTAGLVWLGVIAHRAIEAHYAIPPGRAFVVLILAVVVFYVIPLALIIVMAIAILVAAIVLDYVPGL
jgi:Yip1-like protein